MFLFYFNFFNDIFLIFFLGLAILFASGIQIYWTIDTTTSERKNNNQSNKTDEKLNKTVENNKLEGDIFQIGFWYVGAIIGSILAMFIVSILTKRSIYVIIIIIIMIYVQN